MWASHRGTTDGVGGIVTTDPGGSDGYSWSEDINTRTVVGEGCTCVGDIGRSDADSLQSIKSHKDNVYCVTIHNVMVTVEQN